MAIYHFSAKVISRAAGSSAVAASAYRSASRLEDERLGRSHDFTNKAGVVHSEVILPEGAPARWADRSTLWNEVEAREVRKDAQVAREVEVSIPREMSREEGVRLARDFVKREFVDRGMVADLNVHWDVGPDGLAKPHAHVMLTMRSVEDGGFGRKERGWNATAELQGWRERWGEHVNARLAELGIDAQIDHRSYRDQGIGLEPQNKIGPAGARREARSEGLVPGGAERAQDHRAIARRNGERIIAEPSVALDAITRQQSTFTDHDLARFVHRHSDDKAQFDRAVSAVKASPELVALGIDGRGRERFSTREMLETERRLERSAEVLAGRSGHKVSAATLERARAAAEQKGLTLGEEQLSALEHVVRPGDLSMTVGYAGTGKSAMLGVAREAWEAEGYQVRGAALSGIAAESLEGGSAIPSRTIASLEHAWGQGRDALTSRDVLVIDEAGMIGSRQMDRVLLVAERAGAKVVLVGDAEQLQAIEAGAAFRALTERHGAAEITQIRRQREDWQREATRELATGRTGAALDRYEAAGMVVGHQDRAAAREAVVEGWDAMRQARPEASQVMLAHTRADVAELNQLARARMRDAGQLGEDQVVATERGARTFAPGDRVMFLRNERSMGVKNGTLGTVEAVTDGRLAVRLDGADRLVGERRQLAFDLKDYAHIDHGYASTIHKSQGVTVDRAHVLATEGLDRHAAYVGMSRHREALAVHYGADDFKDRDQLVRTLGRERAKDTTLDYHGQDYDRTFAERRGLVRSEIHVPRGPAPEVARVPKRSMFDGLELGLRPGLRPESLEGLRPAAGERASALTPGVASEFGTAVDRYARAWSDAERMRAQDLPVLEHQKAALRETGQKLEAARPGAVRDFVAAVEHQPSMRQALAGPSGPDRARQLVAGLDQEARVRADPALAAERLVKTWRGLEAEHGRLQGFGQAEARGRVEARMKALVGEVKRDPQLEALMRARSRELGIGAGSWLDQVLQAPTIGQALTRGLSLGRGLGLSR